jgi:hypothetical protein
MLIKPNDGLSEQRSVNDSETYTAEDMYDSSYNYTANRSYSIWFFISSWGGVGIDQNILFERAETFVDGDEEVDNYAVKIAMDGGNNDLLIKSYGEKANAATECKVENIPLQKWINVIITIYNRSIDTYLNGKLINTCVLDNTIKSSKGQGVTVGNSFVEFKGNTSKFQYFDHIVNPQEAWDIYSNGFAESNWVTSLFKFDYGLKLAVTKDGHEIAST